MSPIETLYEVRKECTHLLNDQPKNPTPFERSAILTLMYLKKELLSAASEIEQRHSDKDELEDLGDLEDWKGDDEN